MKLRLKLYPVVFLLALTCCGCFSVEFQTDVNRRGGGTRVFEILMDPVMAGVYKKTGGSDKFFKIPGQGLRVKSGVSLTGTSENELDDGRLKLAWSYRTRKVGLFSDGNDSVKMNITKSGLWVFYEYRETISASKPDPEPPATDQNVYRIRHKLLIPGQIISHNSDSVQSGALVWNRSLGQVTTLGLIMESRSREINPLYLLLSALVMVAGGGCYYWNKAKPVNNS